MTFLVRDPYAADHYQEQNVQMTFALQKLCTGEHEHLMRDTSIAAADILHDDPSLSGREAVEEAFKLVKEEHDARDQSRRTPETDGDQTTTGQDTQAETST